MSSPAEPTSPIADQARAFAPVVWLIGKVQSGKTSIVRTLTEASDAEIGSGFRACTRWARVFDFPGEVPIIRFLDTRGLGEVEYQPHDDIAFCEGRAHLILAVAKALDLEQHSVVEVIRQARARHPDWPVVVAQTSLHEGYATGQGHILPYPFAAPTETMVPANLQRALLHQRSQFETLPGRGALSFVAIDFTQAGDVFEPVDYGRESLIDALIAAAPSAVGVALSELPSAGPHQAQSTFNAQILGFAVAAGAGDAVPVAGAVVVPGVQAAMLHRLAKLRGVEWDRRAYAEFAGALGAGTLLRVAASFGVRQLVKLVPVYGQTAGAAAAAAASFATTYAMGHAASYFLGRRQRGVRMEEVAAVYQRALKDAFRLAKARDDIGGKNGGDHP